MFTPQPASHTYCSTIVFKDRVASFYSASHTYFSTIASHEVPPREDEREALQRLGVAVAAQRLLEHGTAPSPRALLWLLAVTSCEQLLQVAEQADPCRAALSL